MEHRLRLKNKGRAHMEANQTDTPGVCLWYRGYAYGTGGYAYGTGVYAYGTGGYGVSSSSLTSKATFL